MSDSEAALRRQAARRRLAGESPEAIARDLGRTRQWVAKWAGCYDPDDSSWAEGRSRAPKRVANRSGQEIEAQVLAIRERLVENPWAQIGAEAIAWELEKLGGPVPVTRTIERILARAGVSGRRRPPTDLVGPRHLQGGVRFHALTQIDVASHHAGIEIIGDRGDQRVLKAFYGLWERHGLPVRLQLDNGGPFVSPTGLGEVVRVFLHQAITPVFIPPREPWRNGTIEHFNDTFDKRFFRAERFSGVEHLMPQESTGHRPRRRPLPAEEIPAGWPAQGRIEFIRFIRSDLRLRILGRSIPMPDGTAYQYLTATLDLSLHDGENLLVSDVDGQMLTRARLRTPRR